MNIEVRDRDKAKEAHMNKDYEIIITLEEIETELEQEEIEENLNNMEG
jgi:hypothetical protein